MFFLFHILLFLTEPNPFHFLELLFPLFLNKGAHYLKENEHRIDSDQLSIIYALSGRLNYFSSDQVGYFNNVVLLCLNWKGQEFLFLILYRFSGNLYYQ